MSLHGPMDSPCNYDDEIAPSLCIYVCIQLCIWTSVPTFAIRTNKKVSPHKQMAHIGPYGPFRRPWTISHGNGSYCYTIAFQTDGNGSTGNWNRISFRYVHLNILLWSRKS